MNSDWEAKRLEEVCEIKPPKKEAKNKLRDTDLVSFLPMEDLGILTKEVFAVQERQLKDVSGSYTYFADNDVLLAKITPCFENGKVGIARNLKNSIGFGSSEYIVFRPKGKIIPDYLYYFLSRPQFRQEGEKMMTGAVGHKRVSKDFIENYILPFPKSLAEQQRIVAILDEAFSAIAKAKENAEKNLQNARELFESSLQAIFTTKGNGWLEKKLGDSTIIKIIDGDRGVNYPQKSDFSDEGYCLFLNTKNVRPDGFNFDTTMFITEEKDRLLRKGKLQRNDVILTTRGTIGNLAVYNESVPYNQIRINSGMLIFRPYIEKLLPAYLFEVLRSGVMKEQTRKYVTGAAQPQLPIKTLVNFTIPLPTIPEQQRIVAQLDTLSAETKRLEAIYQQKLDNLAALKQSILQKAFAGELHTEMLVA